jgi:hypothetical protein
MADQGAAATAPATPAFSFGFSKSRPAKSLAKSALEAPKKEEEDSNVTDFVTEISKSDGIKGSIVRRSEPLELVIPCKGNSLRFGIKKDKSSKPDASPIAAVEEGEEDTLTKSAAAELLADSKAWQESKDNEDAGNADSNAAIASLADRDLDAGEEAADGELSTFDDYENVPVEGYGMAMLRGMGFVATEGIGGFKKAVVSCIEAVPRPAGLGLGAARPAGPPPSKRRKDKSPEKNGKKSGSRERSRDKSPDRGKKVKAERHDGLNRRDGDKDRGQNGDKARKDRSRDTSIDRDWDRSRDRDRDRDRDGSKDRDRRPDKDRSRDRDRNRSRERSRDRDKRSDRDKDRRRDRSRDKKKKKKDRSRSRDRYR